MPDDGRPGVDLYWLPLGAGGRFVRLNGKAYEALVALRERRRRLDLYHSALVVDTGDTRYAIESTPVPRGDRAERGAVAGGPGRAACRCPPACLPLRGALPARRRRPGRRRGGRQPAAADR